MYVVLACLAVTFFSSGCSVALPFEVREVKEILVCHRHLTREREEGSDAARVEVLVGFTTSYEYNPSERRK